jgi:hydrogenase nickel incorporation protein HypB
MCDTCGCEDNEKRIRIIKPGEEEQFHEHAHSHLHHEHHHSHEHDDHQHSHDPNYSHDHGDHPHEHQSHHHPDTHSHVREIKIEQNVLSKNNLIAERNRGYFEARNIIAVNMVSSPGSGKTRLLERTIKELSQDIHFFIIEGDQQTMNDANRIKEAGAPVVQVNTGNGCHLDAEMINHAVKVLEVRDHSLLIIENVGNLVCPALFDLGEAKRVVIISVTEGDDKPLKYPNMFQTSDLCIINKTDLLPYVDFDISKAKEYAHSVNHHLEFIELSVRNGNGLQKWYDWLKNLK